MSKKVHYLLLLLLVLTVSTGCETMKDGATGFAKDVQNARDPDKNGWNAIKKADAWMQQNMW